MRNETVFCALMLGLCCLTGCGGDASSELPPETTTTTTTTAATTTTSRTTVTSTTTSRTTTRKATKFSQTETTAAPPDVTVTEGTADTADVTTTTRTTKGTFAQQALYKDVSFSRKEILAAAGIPDTYLSFGYLDVEQVTPSYGTATVMRDNGMYVMPQGFDIHYTTEIRVTQVPVGKTVAVTGTAFVNSFETAPDGTITGVKLEATGKFVLTKIVE